MRIKQETHIEQATEEVDGANNSSIADIDIDIDINIDGEDNI